MRGMIELFNICIIYAST